MAGGELDGRVNGLQCAMRSAMWWPSNYTANMFIRLPARCLCPSLSHAHSTLTRRPASPYKSQHCVIQC